MKKILAVLLTLVIAAAVMLSGCTSPIKSVTGSGDDATPTPRPGSGSGTSSGDGSDLSSRSLFDSSNLNFYEWRWTSTSEGETNTFNYRVERGTESYNGAPTKFKKVTFTDNGETSNTITMYYDSTGEKVIAFKSDETVIEVTEDNEAMAHAFDAYDVGLLWANYDYDLSNGVPDVLSINGKTYTAMKYTVSSIYGGTSMWSATVDGKQMCVQIQYKDAQGNSLLYQLWDWG